MSRIFISGLINLETTLAVEQFPLAYFPACYPFLGIQTTVSGVGFNLALALKKLGNQVDLASLIGPDDNGILARKTLRSEKISDSLVLDLADATAQSVILYDPGGRRQIHVDLKDIQECCFPKAQAQDALEKCDAAILCNINFTRPLLHTAQVAGKLIVTDVHALADLEDDYNQDFMKAAEILFLSHEALPASPEDVARALLKRYLPEIIVNGLGAKGALLAVRRDNFIGRFPAAYTRPVVNTIGAGDALLAAFVDCYLRTHDPYLALKAAMVFASYKIGESGAAQGLLGRDEFERLITKMEE